MVINATGTNVDDNKILYNAVHVSLTA